MPSLRVCKSSNSLHVINNNSFNFCFTICILEAIVVVQDNFKHEIASLPAKHGLKIKLDIVVIPKTADDFGTADSLRFIHEKIKVSLLKGFYLLLIIVKQ